jgi:hypothetical protein
MTEQSTSPKQATPERFAPAEAQRRIHSHVAMAGTSIDDLLTPAYWARIARAVP